MFSARHPFTKSHSATKHPKRSQIRLTSLQEEPAVFSIACIVQLWFVPVCRCNCVQTVMKRFGNGQKDLQLRTSLDVIRTFFTCTRPLRIFVYIGCIQFWRQSQPSFSDDLNCHYFNFCSVLVWRRLCTDIQVLKATEMLQKCLVT